jgi:hypothetical protein
MRHHAACLCEETTLDLEVIRHHITTEPRRMRSFAAIVTRDPPECIE